jgi:rod shape-determining protein MreD
MRNFNAIIFTLFIALILTLLPMPGWTAWARPAWVLMVLIYWAMITPNNVNVGFAFVVGLVMDIVTGSVLGEHALALTLVIYMVYRSRMRINMYPVLQQGFSILLFIITYQLTLYVLQGIVGGVPHSRLYWLSSLTSVLLWPWFYVLMRDYCQWFRVSLTEL